MKLKPWKKIPITIRAAYVGGLFVLLAAVVSWLPSVIDRYDRPTVVSVLPTGGQVAVSPVERARSIIEQYFDIPDEEIVDPNVVWFDLLGTGSSQEFYGKYRRGFTEYIVVFSVRKDESENLYFATSKGGCLLRGSHVAVDGKTYFLCTSNAGSGGYLDISVFDYDGIGKLHLIHKEEGIFQGHMYVVDNRIYVAGNNKRYELKLSSGEFRLVQYAERLTAEVGSGCHVLSYHIKSDKLVIKYDGNVIEFRKRVDSDIPQGLTVSASDVPIASTQTHRYAPPPGDAADKQPRTDIDMARIMEIGGDVLARMDQLLGHDGFYVSQNPIILQSDEQILVDDNIAVGEPQQIRLLRQAGDWIFREGFFTAYIPKSKGIKELSICHNYGDWYRITIHVE